MHCKKEKYPPPPPPYRGSGSVLVRGGIAATHHKVFVSPIRAARVCSIFFRFRSARDLLHVHFSAALSLKLAAVFFFLAYCKVCQVDTIVQYFYGGP